jgi:hypothetical protein
MQRFIAHSHAESQVMLHIVRLAIKNYCTKIVDPREMDAISMTLHDCIRLIEQEREGNSLHSARRAKEPALNIKWNLDSLQHGFI